MRRRGIVVPRVGPAAKQAREGARLQEPGRDRNGRGEGAQDQQQRAGLRSPAGREGVERQVPGPLDVGTSAPAPALPRR